MGAGSSRKIAIMKNGKKKREGKKECG